ncbi:glycerophosphodiester phosphodiesterase family protein [Catenovulum agarivorans]|uniref:glycerophosphodiester phosphodiesterase family protein n=1 Tax=Catenovulum agarivorans TaxID=1172192 RepID=UPI0002E91596|nr:glycerophosphodiester phosphodiesterase family protein [Catenovulum agarivorans]
MENTQASISKALELGADVVEIDIRKTADNQLIVFHDNTFDCRTNAKGATEDFTLAQIKTFDVGYGYTADNGQTYPFRGKGIGLILSLAEVLQSFPDTQFLINFKDGRVKAADELVEYLQQHQLLARTKLLVYGNRKTVERLKYLVANAKGGDKTTAKACFKAYMKWG